MRKLSLFFIALVLLHVPSFSHAQSTVEFRADDKDGYTRLVFDWPTKTGYSINKDTYGLNVTFEKEAIANLSKLQSRDFRNIGNVDVLSSNDEVLKISIPIKENSRYRDFKIGQKIIVDVYDASGEITQTKSSTPNSSSDKEPSSSQPNVSDLTKAIEENENPPSQLGGIEPHVINLTTTTNVGMAVFERAGFLWVILDDPSLDVAPVILGPQKPDFGKFEKFPLTEGAAYRLEKPKNYNFYGEGGGILWRVVMTPNPRAVKPVQVKTEVNAFDKAELVWPLKGVRKIIDFEDPLLKDTIKVVTVNSSAAFAGAPRQFVDLETLPSPIGLAFIPKSDDLKVSSTDRSLILSKPNGMAVSLPKDIEAVVLKDDIQKEDEAFERVENPSNMASIFKMDRWEMGGQRALEKNRRILMVSTAIKSGSERVEDLITLAKLNIANDRGHEALGLLRVATQELPGIERSPEFVALRGAAAALAKKYDEAIEDFANPVLERYGEVNYWKAFTLAGLEDWRQATKVAPKDYALLQTYPDKIRAPIELALAEVALREGDTDNASKLLSSIQRQLKELALPQRSHWKYLNGELKRQTGDVDAAVESWEKLITGRDDYYRAKAGLSLTKLQLERKKITPAKAIDRLEGLRYAWRGDELETLVNLRLGEVYVQNNDYLKGLSVLRNAVGLAPDAAITKEVTNFMTDTFQKLFTDGTLENVSALEAVSIYDEFKELTPIGDEGDLFIQQLAERLVEVDLLGRADDLLEHQLNHRLKGLDAAKVAVRLAAIRLLDNNPEGALGALDQADNALKESRNSGPQDFSQYAREAKLLRARALSKIERAGDALAILRNMKTDNDLIRLRADIAWNAGLWSEAEKAFADLIAVEGISTTRPPSDYQANLLLNRSIALNLAGNRTGVENMRGEYGDVMKQTGKAQLFELVTRPRQLGLVGNRDAITSLISEVDLFGDFLESYRQIN